MLTRLQIKFKNANVNDINTNTASLFHGFIMENIAPEYSAFLHENHIKPYSQHILNQGGEVVWELNTLTKDAYNNITQPLLDRIDSVYLRQRQTTLYIADTSLYTVTYDNLRQKNRGIHFLSEIPFNILTPISFKENGRYINYLNTVRFFANIIRRYETYSDIELNKTAFLAFVHNNIEVSDYCLKSTCFHVEGVKIPAFNGRLKLKLVDKKNTDFNELVATLTDFAEFSSVGIKTALGMGAVKKL